MKDPRIDSPENAQRVIDALAELFDALATTDRAVAEDELRELGLDPATVGDAVEDVVANALATPGASVGRRSARRLRSASPQRSATAERRETVGRVSRRRSAVTIAITLLIGVAVGAFWMRTADHRLARVPNTPPASQQDAGHIRPAPRPQSGTANRAGPGGDTVPPAKEQAAAPEADPQVASAGPVTRNPAPELVAAPAVVDASLGAANEASTAAAIAAIRQTAAQTGRLDRTNWELATTLLPKPILNRVKNGEYTYKLVDVDSETLRQGYSQVFWEASAANAGKYDLDPATCGLRSVATGKIPDFYFGYPFPRIDPRDPQAACKMAWNFAAATAMGEGQKENLTMSGVDATGEFKRIQLWRHSLYYQGRHSGPIPNPGGLRQTSMSAVTDPRDVDGVAGLWKRLNDWTSDDQGWYYVPATRRVRRVNSATRSDPIAGIDIYAEDVNCYGGKIEFSHWKLIGDGAVLAPLLASQPLPLDTTAAPTRFELPNPLLRAAYETAAPGAPWLMVDSLVFTPRPVWIIEGTTDDPYYNFGKVIMYMDKDLYRIYWKLVHNRAGEYFSNTMCAYRMARTADGAFSAVTHDLTVGVNDRTNRAGLVRTQSSFIERHFDQDDYFTLHHLTHMSD